MPIGALGLPPYWTPPQTTNLLPVQTYWSSGSRAGGAPADAIAVHRFATGSNRAPSLWLTQEPSLLSAIPPQTSNRLPVQSRAGTSRASGSPARFMASQAFAAGAYMLAAATDIPSA